MPEEKLIWSYKMFETIIPSLFYDRLIYYVQIKELQFLLNLFWLVIYILIIEHVFFILFLASSTSTTTIQISIQYVCICVGIMDRWVTSLRDVSICDQ